MQFQVVKNYSLSPMHTYIATALYYILAYLLCVSNAYSICMHACNVAYMLYTMQAYDNPSHIMESPIIPALL